MIEGFTGGQAIVGLLYLIPAGLQRSKFRFETKIILLAVIAGLTIASADAGWVYFYPDFNWFGYRDRNGVLHSFQADQARYNNQTRDYEVLIRGRWLSVGSDIFQLTNF